MKTRIPKRRNPPRRAYALVKRGMDVAGSLMGLGFLFLIMPAMALAIKLDSRGPLFFFQTRIGQYGKKFRFIKFRTMIVDSHLKQWELDSINETGGPTFKSARDPRVTRVGRLLRKSSLDEMPQFWNVLLGQMSLVGPRPPLLYEVDRYDDTQKLRLTVPQGITGLWQVRGRSDTSFKDMVDLDVHYALHCNLWTDMKILYQTVPTVLFGRGAH